MPQTLPMSVPTGASLYLFSYGTSPTPLARRLAEVAQRASVRYGAAEPTLVVPEAEFAAYAAAQEGEEMIYHLLPSAYLGAGLVSALIPTDR